MHRGGHARRVLQNLPSAQPRAGGHRRTAPFRRGTARIVECQRLHGTALAGHDGHADPAHRCHDLVRRPRHLLAHRTARRPQADPHIRRARSERPADGGNVRSDSQAYRRGGNVPTWSARASTPTRRMPTMRAVQAMRKSVPHSTPHTIWARMTNSANSGRRCIPSRKSRNACDRCRNSPASVSPR